MSTLADLNLCPLNAWCNIFGHVCSLSASYHCTELANTAYSAELQQNSVLILARAPLVLPKPVLTAASHTAVWILWKVMPLASSAVSDTTKAISSNVIAYIKMRRKLIIQNILTCILVLPISLPTTKLVLTTNRLTISSLTSSISLVPRGLLASVDGTSLPKNPYTRFSAKELTRLIVRSLRLILRSLWTITTLTVSILTGNT